jgi:transposase
MGGSAGAVSAVSDLPSPLPAVGPGRPVRTHPGGVGARPQGARWTRSLRVFHRWHVHRGEKGGGCVGPRHAGKGTKLMAGGKLADRAGLPLAVCAASVTPHESCLVAPTLDSRVVGALPQRLIGDRAYDADPVDAELAKRGVEMIAPHRRNRKRPKTQDGRPLRRYKRRWKIERLFAWLGNVRRLVVRYERHALNYLGFVHLGCILILLRRRI